MAALVKWKLTGWIYAALLMAGCQGSGNDPRSPLTVDSGEPKIEMDTLPAAKPSWSLDYIMGKFDPAQDSAFSKIDPKYADREGLFLRTEVYEAFKEMYEAAQADSVVLIIRSATRNFEYQKKIWELKWIGETRLQGARKASDIVDPIERARAILLYSSMPGTSRHHWGTDIDLNAFNNGYFAQGDGLKIYRWLKNHASDFGFCQPYTAKDSSRPVGYEEEKWHWSYLPLSKSLLEEAQKSLKAEMISGFLGAELAPELQVVQTYVLGVDSTCLMIPAH